MSDGLFTHPGPDGIFGRGGPPGNGDSPPIDGDGVPLRETLLVAYPSPGHMRVARATRHPVTGKIVEFQEEYREPTPEEAALLKEKGLVVGPGSMVVSQTPVAPNGINGLGEEGFAPPAVAPSRLGKALQFGAIFAAGAFGYWAANKWVVPLVMGDGRKEDEEPEEPEEDEE